MKKNKSVTNDSAPHCVEKFVAPTQFIHEPYGTLWIHLKDNNEKDTYVQISENEVPRWILISDLLLAVFASKLNDKSFIDECLLAYQESLPLSYSFAGGSPVGYPPAGCSPLNNRRLE